MISYVGFKLSIIGFNIMKSKNSLRIDIGLFLRKSRINKSLTGLELGKLLNVSQQQISRYERGETGISIELLDLMLKALDKNWVGFFFSVIANHADEVYKLKMFE